MTTSEHARGLATTRYAVPASDTSTNAANRTNRDLPTASSKVGVSVLERGVAAPPPRRDPGHAGKQQAELKRQVLGGDRRICLGAKADVLDVRAEDDRA